MSNYWRLRCLTCSDDIGTRWNHGNEAVKAIARRHGEIASAFADLGEIATECDMEIEVKAHYEYLDLDWMRAHKDHDVRAADEYGRVFAMDGTLDAVASTPQAVEWERRAATGIR